MTAPQISVNQLCLPRTTFAEDVRIASELGYDGISIDVSKLGTGPDAEAVDAFARSGLKAAVCCNGTWSMLPIPNFPTPVDAEERIDGICEGARRLAPFHPASYFVVLGQPGLLSTEQAWRVIDAGLKKVHDVVSGTGATLSIEVMTREGGRLIDEPMVASIGETLELLERLGLDDVQIVADVWHLFDSPHFLDDLRLHADRISAIQMCDYHRPRRWRDRLMPGDGSGRVREALSALDEGGFSGWLDLEVFSDDLWKESPRDFMALGLSAIRTCWDERRVAAA
jgi:sugar phosphate isomerase/epimerase